MEQGFCSFCRRSRGLEHAKTSEMKQVAPLFLFFVFACGDPEPELKVSKDLLQGTWQFFDKDSVYTEMEISDSVYFYVHTPMYILRAEPVLYSVMGDSFHLVYEDGEKWKSYGV